MVRTRDAAETDRLIAQYIERHPAKEGLHRYRLTEEEGGCPVWAIIGNLKPGIMSEDQVAREFHISREAMDARHAFYARHTEAIDAWLVVNSDS